MAGIFIAAGWLIMAVLKSIFALLDFFFGGTKTSKPAAPAPEAQPAYPTTPWWRHLIIAVAVVGIVALTFAIAMAVSPGEAASPGNPPVPAAAMKKVQVREVGRTTSPSRATDVGR